MAIKPGYKQFTFDGENSGDYGVYITGSAVYNSPKRDVELIEIPGRNGAFVLDNGRFENIEVTYPAGIYAESQEDFAQAISDLRNMLASRKGYCRLTDEYNPEEYRMAVYKSGLDVDPVAFQRAGEFSITFDCKPQRWLTSGEVPVTIGEWGETETASGDIVSVENPNGILAVKSLEVDLEPIQDLHGYDAPWVGGAGKNKYPIEIGADTWVDNASATHSNNNGELVIVCTSQTSSGVYGNGTQKSLLNQQSVTKTVSFDIKGSVATTVAVQSNIIDITTSYQRKSITINANTTASLSIYARGTAVTVSVKNLAITEDGSTAYEPYENICPISGHTDVVVSRTGVNVWDEEWELGGFNADGSKSAVTDRIRSKNYIPCVGNTSYYIKQGTLSDTAWSYFVFYDANKSVIGSRVTVYGTFTTPSNAQYMKFNANNSYGATYNNDISINYPSTDTSYHAYEGDTYTTALGRTVYGGTLDVTTGTLTVDRAIVTYDGSSDENWNFTTLGSMFRAYIAVADIDTTTSDTSIADIVSNQFSAISYVQGQNNVGISARFNIAQINVFQNEYTTLAEWKSYLALNPLQVVYELATPTTTTLTAQQVELLIGQNNIWSDSGDITLEYGQNPSVLVNPTLFESSPLLEATGSGAIQFNGYEIDFAGIPYGEVQLCRADSRYDIPVSDPYRFAFSYDIDNLLNSGDVIYPDYRHESDPYADFGIQAMVVANDETSGAYDIESAEIISSANTLDVRATVFNGYYGQRVNIFISPNLGTGFVYGTTKTITSSAVCKYRYRGTDYTETIQVTITYDGARLITVNMSMSGTVPSGFAPYPWRAQSPYMYGDSTVPIQGVPIYIDCDLGEAYYIKDGEYVSLNQQIDLGSELPKLASGSNTVTFDNTITELKVTPRWWKV